MNIETSLCFIIYSLLVVYTTAPSPPTGPRAIVITGSNSIVVSWTPPSGGTPPTGYSIYYEAISGGADTGSVTVSGARTSEVTITGRASGAYTVRIVALSDQLPSNVTAEINTTVGRSMPIVFYWYVHWLFLFLMSMPVSD